MMMAAVGPRKQLPARHSRGTRIRQLMGEEAEADESFWGQSAWHEDAEDDDYSTEAEEEDVVDSDFDEDEQPDEDVHDLDGADDDDSTNRTKRRRHNAQSGAYREPVTRPSLVYKPPPPPSTPSSTRPQTTATFQYEAPTVRRSTAEKSSLSSELRSRQSSTSSRRVSDLSTASSRRASSSSQAPVPQLLRQRLTQSQLLIDAVQTEVANVQSLGRLERLEEEKRVESLAPPHARNAHVEIVRMRSCSGTLKTITFLNATEWPALFQQAPPMKRLRPIATAARTTIRSSVRHEEEEEEEEEEEKDNEEENGENNMEQPVVEAQ